MTVQLRLDKLVSAFADCAVLLLTSPSPCTQAALVAFVMSALAHFFVIAKYQELCSLFTLIFLGLFVLSHALSGFYPPFCRSREERILNTHLAGAPPNE